jgi:hypothetical protein
MTQTSSTLDAHYRNALHALGLNPNTLPKSLFFTFCGPVLGHPLK